MWEVAALFYHDPLAPVFLASVALVKEVVCVTERVDAERGRARGELAVLGPLALLSCKDQLLVCVLGSSVAGVEVGFSGGDKAKTFLLEGLTLFFPFYY